MKSISNSKERQQAFRAAHIPLYSECELSYKTVGSFGKSQAHKSWFLKITDQEKSSCYAKDDVWIICASDKFEPSSKGGVVVAKSVYHGPSANMVQLDILSGAPSKLSDDEPLFAIRGPNFGSYFEMIGMYGEQLGIQNIFRALFYREHKLLESNRNTTNHGSARKRCTKVFTFFIER